MEIKNPVTESRLLANENPQQLTAQLNSFNSTLELLKSQVERKKTAIETLKSWDLKTKHNIQVVKSLVDNMYLGLEDILARSFKRYEKIFHFFEKIKLSLQSEINFSDQVEVFRFNSVMAGPKGPEVREEGALHDSITLFDNEFRKFTDGFRMLQLKIKNQINAKILTENVKPYENNIKSLYAQIAGVKKSLQKISLATTDKLEELMKALRDSQIEVGKARRPKINVLDFVTAFVFHVETIADLVKEYGLLFIKLYEESLQLEKYRLNSIKESFLTYIKILSDFFGKENDKNFVQSQALFAKLDETLLSESSLDLQLLVKPTEAEQVLRKTGATALSVVALRDFIIAPKYQESIHEIIQYFYLKRYPCFLIESTTQHVEVDIYLTSDHFYSIYKTKGQRGRSEQLLSMPIEDVKIASEKGKDSLTFRYQEKFLLWNTKKKQTFLFLNNSTDEVLADQKQELNTLNIKFKAPILSTTAGVEISQSIPTLSQAQPADSLLVNSQIETVADPPIVASLIQTPALINPQTSLSEQTTVTDKETVVIKPEPNLTNNYTSEVKDQPNATYSNNHDHQTAPTFLFNSETQHTNEEPPTEQNQHTDQFLPIIQGDKTLLDRTDYKIDQNESQLHQNN